MGINASEPENGGAKVRERAVAHTRAPKGPQTPIACSAAHRMAASTPTASLRDSHTSESLLSESRCDHLVARGPPLRKPRFETFRGKYFQKSGKVDTLSPKTPKD